MRRVEQLDKIYYCPIKSNRRVDDFDAKLSHQRFDQLDFSQSGQIHGQSTYLKNLHKSHYMMPFQRALFIQRTEYLVTNDLFQDSATEISIQAKVRSAVKR